MLAEKADQALLIKIADNGSGFPNARPDEAQDPADSISESRIACRRIRELGGSLTVPTSAVGAELEIRIPLQ